MEIILTFREHGYVRDNATINRMIVRIALDFELERYSGCVLVN